MKKIISCAILSACFCIYSQQIAAEVQDSESEIDCPAQTVAIDSQRAWIVTDESCPIGKGIYDQAPSQKNNIFWLQCSYASQMPSKSFADKLESVVSIDMVVIRKENSGKYRCLIGPFVNYDDVVYLREELNKNVIKTFIREVPKSHEAKPAALSKTPALLAQSEIAPAEAVKQNVEKVAESVKAEKNVAAPAIKEAAVKEVTQNQEASKAQAAAEKLTKAIIKKDEPSVAQVIAQQQADNVLAQLSKVKEAKNAPAVEKAKPVTKPTIKPAPKPFAVSASHGDLVTIGDKQFYKIGDLYSPVPSEDQQSHFEIDKEWWRASLRQATEVCTKNSMEVVTMARLREVANNNVTRDKLPKRLPFWVSEKKAFDIMMMVPMSLTENSAIYVLCQPAS
ncbi:MAG: hypothetical protein ACRC9R_12610 [Enterovibrio sp.]